jgi:hypothetical protein
MSGKIKAKDLQYDSTLPPFLQRLHAQKAGRGDTDRHEQQVARPKRAKDTDADDGPTIVDESGEVVSKAEYESITKSGEAAREAPGEGVVEGGDVGGSVTGKVADDAAAKVSGALPNEDSTPGNGEQRNSAIGAKKRKAVKVIGDDGAEDEPAKPKGGDKVKIEKNVKMSSKPKKKAKAIKLAFDDADDG